MPRLAWDRWTLVLAGLLLGAVGGTHWVRLNVSPSVPRGFYWVTAVPMEVTSGMLVVLPVPVALRQWQTMPLLKPVAAVAGEMICWDAGRLWVHGEDYGPDVPGVTAVWHPDPGCVPVPRATVFLASPVPRSLDGRYMGVTRIADLTARALPLWTWR